ncbi:hypothetical protein [Xylocopilactobacillus apis]|uniref:Uncharacterized protein n=1 Tax=Xylocopilactobacillus apis TaxID=2932183 RepID=A0AAU9DLN0_9LACO|nr:hypothetical protein [Xylocopilactobacillus apis]BDR55733.1 hypothetical protein KIMC2_02950 [Xylocopilactobacillus apis]
MNIERLLGSLNVLVAALDKGGKTAPANFFSDKIKQIQSSCDDPGELDSVLQELTSCRAMAQYGDFSSSEEKCLDTVIDDSIAWLQPGKSIQGESIG